MYANARYSIDLSGNRTSIQCDINGAPSSVPLDPANSDYASIMSLAAEGKLVIAEPEAN